MADQKISELTALTGANAADDDALAIVDTSAVETKKITRSELFTDTPTVLVGGTDTFPHDNAATSGTAIGTSGYLSIARSGGISGYFNRMSSDGDIVQFRKGGSTVGNIGNDSTNLYMVFSTAANNDVGISSGDLGTNEPTIFPTDGGGSVSNGNVSLGYNNGRWKDLYLSGGVVFGDAGGSGTSTSNTLDSYEEGTFTPTFVGSTSGTVTLNSTFDKYAYTKVGRVVTITGRVDVSGTPSLSGNLLFQGLPFSTGDLLDSAGFTVQYGFITIGSSNTGNPIVVELPENATQATLRLENWNSAAGVLTNNSRIQMSITYFTN